MVRRGRRQERAPGNTWGPFFLKREEMKQHYTPVFYLLDAEDVVPPETFRWHEREAPLVVEKRGDDPSSSATAREWIEPREIE
jgi:hypothetical protein